MQLTPQETQAMLTFLNRVDLKGSEAESMAILKQKLRDNLKPQAVAPEDLKDLEGESGEG